MSISEEEYEELLEEFISEQVALINKANLEVEKNSLVFHRNNCESSAAGCENTYMAMMLAAIGQRIIDDIDKKNRRRSSLN